MEGFGGRIDGIFLYPSLTDVWDRGIDYLVNRVIISSCLLCTSLDLGVGYFCFIYDDEDYARWR